MWDMRLLSPCCSPLRFTICLTYVFQKVPECQMRSMPCCGLPCSHVTSIWRLKAGALKLLFCICQSSLICRQQTDRLLYVFDLIMLTAREVCMEKKNSLVERANAMTLQRKSTGSQSIIVLEWIKVCRLCVDH